MKTYPLFKVHLDVPAAMTEIQKVLESGYINEGVQVAEFRKQLEIGKYIGYTVPVNSCTSALTLALHMCNVREGDEVITTPMTCVATNTPIATRGAKVVWCDISPDTGMIDPEALRKIIKPTTKAVMYVAWAGNLGQIEAVHDICKANGVPLILDAAHAFGVKYNGDAPTDSLAPVAEYACYSFQAIKHVTTGDGGALSMSYADFDKPGAPNWNRARNLKWFGLDRDAGKDEKGDWKGQQWDVDIAEAGFKFNMNNISAAIGLSQLPHIDKILDGHKRNAALYDELFAERRDVTVLKRSVHEDGARWVYTILTTQRNAARLALVEKLNADGIKAGLVHIPNDLYTCFQSSKTDLPGTREFAARQFSIPCGWWLSEEDVRYIASRVLHHLDAAGQ